MAQIIPEEMYWTNICSICRKYLSILPVKVYESGIVKCGRCSDKHDGGTISQLYNQLVENHLFKCINRYEGCRFLLKPSDMRDHEKYCCIKSSASGTYRCPLCIENIHGSAYDIIQHCQQTHRNKILTRRSFNLNYYAGSNLKKKFLYIEEDFVFVIVSEYVKDTVFLSACQLTQVGNNINYGFTFNIGKKCIDTRMKKCVPIGRFKCDDYFKITSIARHIRCRLNLDYSQSANYVYKLLNRDQNIQKNVDNTKPEPDKSIQKESQVTYQNSVAIQTIPIKNIRKIILTENFHETFPGYEITPCGTALYNPNNNSSHRVDLVCSNCKQFTGSNVYSCSTKNHLLCWDCKAWCNICSSSSTFWNSDVASIIDLLLLPCRWDCGEMLKSVELRDHQLICNKFMKKCYLCVTRLPYLDLLPHMKIMHRRVRIEKIHDSLDLLSFLKSTPPKKDRVYFLQNTYLLCLSYEYVSEDVFSILIDVLDNLPAKMKFVLINNRGGRRYFSFAQKISLVEGWKIFLEQ